MKFCWYWMVPPDKTLLNKRSNLRFRHARSQHFQDVTHANAHATNARTTATLQRIERDAVNEFFACRQHECNNTPEVALVTDHAAG